MMKNFTILTLVLLFSCTNKTGGNAVSMNQVTDPIDGLQKSVVELGDTAAYYSLFLSYIDQTRQDDFFYYSYIMACKYRYPKACIDLVLSLCQLYKINIESDKIDLSKMDASSKSLVLQSLRCAMDSNYLDARSFYKKIVFDGDSLNTR